MRIIPTEIQDLVIIQPKTFKDARGYFLETYKESWFKENFPNITFVQDNESKSDYGTLRGLHYQNPPFAQAKLIRVILGVVMDVTVDLRKNSKTYGKHFSIILSAENKKQLLVPRGFAHGFLVLSKTAIFSYKVDNIYSKEHDTGLAWNDQTLAIDWNIDAKDVKLSEKDKNLIKFNQFKSPF